MSEPAFLARVVKDPESGCWTLPRGHAPNGYLHVSVGGRGTTGHRAAYEYLVGPVPPGLDLDHLCRNRGCCNPAHLEPVTRAENLRRGIRGKRRPKTHCKRGHEFTEITTYVNPGTGHRFCRPCLAMHKRNERAAR